MVVGNGKYGILVSSSARGSISNCIVIADGPGTYAVYWNGTSGALDSDFNDLVAINGASVGYSALAKLAPQTDKFLYPHA